MSLLSSKMRSSEDNGLLYWCPGCDMAHQVKTGTGEGPRWSWNGDTERPVFGPSVLVRYDHMSEAGRARCADFRAEHGRNPTKDEVPYDEHHVCHTFVGCGGAQPGEVIFLGDCTHHLAGTVQLFPDLPEWMR